MERKIKSPWNCDNYLCNFNVYIKVGLHFDVKNVWKGNERVIHDDDDETNENIFGKRNIRFTFRFDYKKSFVERV